MSDIVQYIEVATIDSMGYCSIFFMYLFWSLGHIYEHEANENIENKSAYIFSNFPSVQYRL